MNALTKAQLREYRRALAKNNDSNQSKDIIKVVKAVKNAKCVWHFSRLEEDGRTRLYWPECEKYGCLHRIADGEYCRYCGSIMEIAQ